MSSSTLQKGRRVKMAATRHLVLLSLLLGSVLASQKQDLNQGDSEADDIPQVRLKRSESLEDIFDELMELLDNMESESQDERMVQAEATVDPSTGWMKDDYSSRGIEDDEAQLEEDLHWCDSVDGGSVLNLLLKKGVHQRREIVPGWNDKSRCDYHECFKDIKTWPAVPYYLLNDANFLITWPTRYIRVFYIFNYNFYNMMKQNISAVEDYAMEAVAVLDKAYKPINFRVLLVGVKVLTEYWPGEGPRPNYNDFLKPKVREYIWNTIRPESPTFHTAVYIASGGVELQADGRSQAVPWPFLGRSLAVPRPFRGRSLAVPRPFLGRSLAVPRPFLGRSLAQWGVELQADGEGPISGTTAVTLAVLAATVAGICHGPPHWDAPYAGAGMGHLCKINGMNDFPYVMAAEGNTRPANHYWNAHELGHEFRNGHNFDPSDGGSSVCPAKRLFGTKCVMGGNSYPTTFSSTFLDKIKATDYSCMEDKPAQEDVFKCGNGILDAGEECDCGNSQSCKTSDPCCDGQICKLKQNAECSSNSPCCNNCKVDLNSCDDDIKGRVKRATDPANIQSYNRIDIPPGVLVPFPAGTTTPRNRVFNWLFEAPAGLHVTLSLAIPLLEDVFKCGNEILDAGEECDCELYASPSFETAVGCPYDWIEVRDGGYMTSPVVGRFCTPMRKPIVSSGNTLLVTFRSDNSFDSHFLMKYSFYSTALSGPKWREDGRCGWNYPAAAAASGQCESQGETPCCFWDGRCKSKDTDCTCSKCVDYRNIDNAGLPTNPVKATETQTLGECYEETGDTYRGTASITISGKVCQAWSSQTPQQHGFDPAAYPNLGLDSNYCRNPDLSTRPWCHTTDPKKHRDFCIIPRCTGLASRSEYVGCYKDTSSRTFPAGRIQNYKNMTNALCINHCAGQGYTYAVTQYSYECSCGDEANFAQLEPKRPEHECNFKCSGNSEEKCGGNWRNSVYKLPEKASSGPPHVWLRDPPFQHQGHHPMAGRQAGAPGGLESAARSDVLYGKKGNTKDITRWHASGQAEAPSGLESAARSDLPYGEKGTDGYSCGDGLKKFQGRCYKAFTEKKSNAEAKSECSSMGGRLAAPKTPEVHGFLVDLAKTEVGNGQDVWIGIQKEDVWKFSDGGALGECSYSNWAPGEPTNNAQTKCAQYWAGIGYKWDDTYCTSTKAFICQTGPATCPDGYGKYGDTCYKLFTEKRSYRLAHATCVNDGGRLAAPKTAGTNDHLISLAKTAGGGNMWIGVDNLNTGVYKYSDGTPLKSCEYTNWAPNEPNGADCVQFWAGRGYKWDDTDCYHEQMFVCQIGPGEDAGCC
ncbi:hypothetical protein Bbelb_126840 [Branchiostoma belcheri]|nr:hypothetical protein Bbelb_126840 [Branchiostoma belcheri]